MGDGGRLRAREAKGDRPCCWRSEAGVGLTLRSIGERGEAGEARRDRPTGPIGEQGTPRLYRLRPPPPGEEGGRMAAFLRSRGVTGDRSKEFRCRGDSGTVNGEDLSASGEGKGTADERGDGRGE